MEKPLLSTPTPALKAENAKIVKNIKLLSQFL